MRSSGEGVGVVLFVSVLSVSSGRGRLTPVVGAGGGGGGRGGRPVLAVLVPLLVAAAEAVAAAAKLRGMGTVAGSSTMPSFAKRLALARRVAV